MTFLNYIDDKIRKFQYNHIIANLVSLLHKSDKISLFLQLLIKPQTYIKPLFWMINFFKALNCVYERKTVKN